jgi:undecaprenyl diphosphate synthase
MNKLPKHVAIIMDGNGRWAKQRGKQRVLGHKKGASAVRGVIEEAALKEIKYLTLFTFSTENWSRPEDEVGVLMRLLVSTLKKEFDRLIKNNIKLKAIGDLDGLPNLVKEELIYVMKKTEKNSGLTLTLALNYGAKEELTQAIKMIANKVKNSIISPEKVDQSTINEHLYSRYLPPVD